MKLRNLSKQIKFITNKVINKTKAFIYSQLGAEQDDMALLKRIEEKEMKK